MSIKIRLKRLGKKNSPAYKFVVVNTRSAVDSGRYLDELGEYNPVRQPALIDINAEKAKAWMAKGAMPTATVAKLMKKANVTA